MNRKFWVLIPITILFLSLHVLAQERHYLIRLKDKNNNPFSINNPAMYLSPRALARRSAQGIAINEKDLPVNPQYVSAIAAQGAFVRCRLKWANSVLISAPENVYNAILQLPFVDGGKPVRRGKNVTTPIEAPAKSKSTQSVGETAQVSVSQNAILGIDTMLSEGFNGAGKIIAVMDAGFRNVNNHVAFEHLFTSGRLLGVWDLVANDNSVYEDHQHGAEVLSNIAANHPDELVAGGHGAAYYLFRTEIVAEEYELEPVLLSRAVEMADSLGVDIINISLGYTTFDDPAQDYNINQLDGRTTISSFTLTEGAKRGMVIVTSAGNYGANQSWSMRITMPADADSILAVGAVFSNGDRAGFSSMGPSADGRIKPDVVAQGVSNKVANVNTSSGYTFKNGTSFSAPTVAGLVAGFWQAFPSLTAKEVVEIIKQSGSRALQPDNMMGYGIPNYNRAKALVSIKQLQKTAEPMTIIPNPAKDKAFSVSVPPSVEHAHLAIYSLAGHKIYEASDLKPGMQAINLNKVALLPGAYTLILRHNNGALVGRWLYRP